MTSCIPSTSLGSQAQSLPTSPSTSFEEPSGHQIPNTSRLNSPKLPALKSTSQNADKLTSENVADDVTTTKRTSRVDQDGSDDEEVLVRNSENSVGVSRGGATRSNADASRIPTTQSQTPRQRILPMLSTYRPVLVLENTGSVARDHLASERTFLAYVRTSLAIASTGVALVQLFTVSVVTSPSDSNTISVSPVGTQIEKYARPLGSTAVGFGIVVLLIGSVRYFTVQHALTQGRFPPARLFMAGIALPLTVIITVVFAALLSK